MPYTVDNCTPDNGMLTTLERAKEYLGIETADETNDEKLTNLILAATAAIQGYCNRNLLSATVAEVRDGNGRCSIRLRTLPIDSIASVVFDYDGDDEETVAGSEYRFNAATGEVRLKASSTSDVGGYFPCGFQNIQFNYIAGYETVPEDLQAICCMIVARIYNQSSRDMGLKSETIGDYSYTINDPQDPSGGGSDLFSDAYEVLNKYKVIEP